MKAPSCPTQPQPARSPIALTLAQWWCVLQGVGAQAQRTNLGLMAAGVAFFGLMALLPAIAALVALFGLIGDPRLVGQQIEALGGVAPDPAVQIIHEQALRLIGSDNSTLITGGVLSFMLSLWGALQGARTVLMALTVMNRRAERHTFFRRYVAAGAFTLAAFGLALLAILVMGAVPIALQRMHLDAEAQALVLFLRWPVLGGAATAVALMLYRWGPRRRPPAWRWLWPGGFGAPIAWVLASSALTFALRIFPEFGTTYGSLASAVALLIWLYLTAAIFLLGGALNAELEFFAHGAPTQPVAQGAAIAPVGVPTQPKPANREERV